MAKQSTVQTQPRYQAPAVHKAFQLLRAVAVSRKHLGVTDLAEQLAYSKSTTHGLIHALVREGALARDAGGRGFYLGPTVAELAFSGWNYMKMRETVQPYIDQVRDRVGETICLGVLAGERVMIMATADAAEPLRISATPGTSISLFTGAVGKAFLAEKEDGDVIRLIGKKGLPGHTSRSIVDQNAYLAELNRARALGYAVDDEEYLAGIRAVAVVLRNRKGPPMAVWAVGLSSSLELEKIESMMSHMFEITEKLRREFS